MLQVPVSSLEYIKVKVTRDDGSNPTSDPCYLAFLPDGESPPMGAYVEGAGYYIGSWDTIDGEYFAKTLIGTYETIIPENPDIPQLTVGFWNVWVKISDNPEIPVRKAGYIEVI
jgi:hypothetical protein